MEGGPAWTARGGHALIFQTTSELRGLTGTSNAGVGAAGTLQTWKARSRRSEVMPIAQLTAYFTLDRPPVLTVPCVFLAVSCVLKSCIDAHPFPHAVQWQTGVHFVLHLHKL